MEKIMLIAGCSHTAGSEIDGTLDSVYNRQHSFGNLLAEKMGYRPINIAVPAATNMGVARSVLQWFKEQYDPVEHEVFVLIAWAECSRMEFPITGNINYKEGVPSIDWFPDQINNFIVINNGASSTIEWQEVIIKRTLRFLAENLEYLEIMSATYALQLQYFLKMNNVNYCMCNTGYMFTKEAKHMKFYLDLLDASRYMNMDAGELGSFFGIYRQAGYVNPLAIYFHHGEEPHRLYAEELHKFITDNNLTNK